MKPLSTIPVALRRAALEAERDDWKMSLVRIQARLEAQQYIATVLGHDTTAYTAGLTEEMERLVTGLVKIEELIVACDAPNGKEPT